MKRQFKINFIVKNVIAVASLITFVAKISAVTPLYTLKVQNIFKTGPNAVEFDINLKHTNPDSSVFEYAAGQYFFDFNTGISNGGTFSYSIVYSDLPSSLQPRNPTVYVSGGEKQLRLTINTIPSPGNGYIVSSTGQGTVIVRMKLQTSALYFDTQFFQLRWRNGPVNPYTKIFAFVNSSFTEITTPQTHTIDSLNIPLPVELKSFIAEVYENKVKLDWTTNRELNNAGFEVQRASGISDWKNIFYVNGAGQSDSLVHYSFIDKNLYSGLYKYRLKQIDYNGDYQYYYLNNDVRINTPANYYLSQNYPNPFNPSTKIDFSLPYNSNVRIILFDLNGREIKTLISEFKSAGYYTMSIDAGSLGLSSGIYYYKIDFHSYKDDKVSIVKKLSYIK